MRPVLVLVTGPPAAGKTTLAHVLGRELSLPVVSKDEIKAGLVRSGGGSGAEIGSPVGQQAWALFLETMERFVAAGVSLVAEQAFERPRSTATLGPFVARASTRIVHLSTPSAVCEQRFRARAVAHAGRRVAHPDTQLLELIERGDLDWSMWEAPDVDAPVLRVDTTNGYDPPLAEILAFVQHG